MKLLQELDLSHNQITSVSFDKKQLNDTIHTLNLAHNNLTKTPSHLIVFQNLQSLDLSHNQLSRFNMFDYFDNDSNETWISFKKQINRKRDTIKLSQRDTQIQINTIQQVYESTPPDDVKQKLDKYVNDLKQLDIELQQLNKQTHAQLNILKLNSNNITHLPLDIKYLSSLKELHIDNNQLNPVPYHFKLKLERLRYVTELKYVKTSDSEKEEDTQE